MLIAAKMQRGGLYFNPPAHQEVESKVFSLV